jgi:hypothetical protein
MRTGAGRTVREALRYSHAANDDSPGGRPPLQVERARLGLRQRAAVVEVIDGLSKMLRPPRRAKPRSSTRRAARRSVRARLRLHAEGADGQHVAAAQPLVESDPFTSAILTEVGGKVTFKDIVEGENVREETDRVTGLTQMIIVESATAEKRTPTITIK